jgi:urease accessory protein
VNAALMILVDGRFPAGGHTNSAGVEAAVRAGDVHDDATLDRYLLGRLATTGLVDAAFASHIAAQPDLKPSSIGVIDAEYSARVVSPQLREASRRFGRQLLRVGCQIWSTPLIDAVVRSSKDGGPHQPIVLGALAAAAGGSPVDAATLVMHHLSAAVTSAGIRLLGLDPMTVASLQANAAVRAESWIRDSHAGVAAWITSPPTDLPACGGSLTEILAEDHGRWGDRLFVA